MNNSFFRTLAESAVRAVNHPDCKKLKVPKKKYETWKETILDFDPSVMINQTNLLSNNKFSKIFIIL